jgi:hypothetical protein
MLVKIIPVLDKDGDVVLWDGYVGKKWIGSRRTSVQIWEQIDRLFAINPELSSTF